MKRFFIIDATSGRQFTSDGKNTDGDEAAKFYDRFTQINYVKSIELRIHILDDEKPDEANKINIPLMVIEYGSLNLTNFTSNIKSSSADAYNVDFTFKIKFVKRPNLNFFFQIALISL